MSPRSERGDAPAPPGPDLAALIETEARLDRVLAEARSEAAVIRADARRAAADAEAALAAELARARAAIADEIAGATAARVRAAEADARGELGRHDAVRGDALDRLGRRLAARLVERIAGAPGEEPP